MKPLTFLAGSSLLLAATTAVIAGHDLLVQQLHTVFDARLASPGAALLIHLMTGIFVLPRARSDPARIALTTAMVAIVLRSATETATGVIITGLPVYSMAAATAAIAGAASLSRASRSRRRRAKPRLVSASASNRAEAA